MVHFPAHLSNQDLFGSIMRQDVAFYDKNHTGELLNRLSSDTQVLQRAVTSDLGTLVQGIIRVWAGHISFYFQYMHYANRGTCICAALSKVML